MVEKSERDQCLIDNILPLGFIRNKSIMINLKPGANCYEDYLADFLNESKWFMSKTMGGKFRRPDSEAHGENDALSDNDLYEIDFKLILGTSFQHVKYLTEPQISTNGTGVTYYLKSVGEGEYKAIVLHVALREYSEKELAAILKMDIRQCSEIEEDIRRFLKSIIKNKNLLLFYPAVFDNSGNNNICNEDVLIALFEDYDEALKIRNKFVKDKETYIGTIYNNNIIIGLCCKDRIVPIDSIRVDKSKTFQQICRHYDMNPLIKSLMTFEP